MKEFLDEFKHLEKICNEIYSEKHGVTLYINEMEQRFGYATRKIPEWDKDLDNLKRVRHIRNNLVHDSEVILEYNDSDIEFIRKFRQRIIESQDPLALLRKQEEIASESRNSEKLIDDTITVSTIATDNVEADESISKTLICGVVLAVLIIFLILALIFI